MRRLIHAAVFSAALVSALLFGTPQAEAHILKQDGQAAAVMHIEPDDNPVAGKNTTLVFDFSGSSLGFDLNDYETDVDVFKGDGLIVDKPLVVRRGGSGSVAVTFPDAGAYQLRVSGKPLRDGTGSGVFILQYNVRVSGGTVGDAGWAQTVLFVGVASLLVLMLIAKRIVESGGRYKKHVQ